MKADPKASDPVVSTRFQRRAEVEAAPLHGETILYHAGTKKFCLLNGTAAFLWDQLGRSSTVDELASAIQGRFDGVDGPGAARDVRSTLDRLTESDFVVQV
jgi:hypothetical protein